MSQEALAQEERNMRRLRFLVNIAEAVLMQSDLSLAESLAFMEDTKRAALSLFPDKTHVYDLIYTRRFRRIIRERFPVLDSLPSGN